MHGMQLRCDNSGAGGCDIAAGFVTRSKHPPHELPGVTWGGWGQCPALGDASQRNKSQLRVGGHSWAQLGWIPASPSLEKPSKGSQARLCPAQSPQCHLQPLWGWGHQTSWAVPIPERPSHGETSAAVHPELPAAIWGCSLSSWGNPKFPSPVSAEPGGSPEPLPSSLRSSSPKGDPGSVTVPSWLISRAPFPRITCP